MVQLSHRNVCQQGFALLDAADAGRWRPPLVSPLLILHLVFLDLPAPWEAIPHAKMAMKVRRNAAPSITAQSLFSFQKDRVARICCFSPCIEQVLRTVMALNQFGFTGACSTNATNIYLMRVRINNVRNTPSPTRRTPRPETYIN
jgi:tRNA (adenine57-N1/adenine58-N1)-methyltransferase